MENNGRRHTSAVVCSYPQFHGFSFEPHHHQSRQSRGSCDGDSANPVNSWMARISRNIKDLKGDFTNSPPQIVINCFQSVFVLVIAIVETEVLNCPLKTVETSLLSRLSRLYCWSWQDSTQASSANHRGSRLQLHADMHILCLNFYCICIWFGIVFVQHFFVQPQRLGGISGRSPVMYLWSGHTATRPSKASVIDSHSSLFTYSPLSPAAATLCLSKRILARGPKMAIPTL